MTNEHKKYNTILIDPPWSRYQASKSRGACRHYSLMSDEEIAGLPISDLAAPDSHLYIWTTNNSLPDAFEIIEKFGFTYRSCIVWVKFRLGMGKYYRNVTEILLFSTRGRAPILCKRQPNLILGPVLEHSRKPSEQYPMIERCSPGPNRLELFARRKERPGWDYWGLEVESDLSIPGYPVPNYVKSKGKV